jgi:hypothetical protein
MIRPSPGAFGIWWRTKLDDDDDDDDDSTGGAASWHEEYYTGTGFPNHFYLGYTFHAHYFPMIALGRYARLRGWQPLKELETVHLE